MNVARHPGAIVVRILRGEDARPAGVGLVVGPREIVTCAHVVNSALGRDRRTQDKPGGGETIEFDFPLLATREPTSATARVTVWQPPPTTGVAGGDIAGLTIAAARLPEGAARALLAAPEEAATGNVEVFGFPADPPRPQGAWVACRLMHRVGGGLVQIDADTVAALKAQPGFSGSAVWDNTRKGVVGMLSVATEVGGSRDAYAIAADLLAEAWPDVLMAPRLRTRELAEPNLRKFRSWMARGEAVVDLDITPEVAFDVCCRAVQVLDPARFSADAARKTIAARTKSRLTSWGPKCRRFTRGSRSGRHSRHGPADSTRAFDRLERWKNRTRAGDAVRRTRHCRRRKPDRLTAPYWSHRSVQSVAPYVALSNARITLEYRPARKQA